MLKIRLLIIPILFCFTLLAGAEDSIATPPTLSIESSKWVTMQSPVLSLENGTLVFGSEFMILGKGIFGHFDMVVYGADGKVITVVKSDDRAWRKDNGPVVKDIALTFDTAEKCAAVSVSFHEMRESPDVGACVARQE